jgi:hypothetical protein
VVDHLEKRLGRSREDQRQPPGCLADVFDGAVPLDFGKRA